MAVGADEAALLVDVGGQFMVFDTIGPEMLLLGGVGGAVFLVQVVFKTAIVIETDGVAIVARQALLVTGTNEDMGGRLAILEGKMAGSTACSVCYGRIIVTLEIEMTTEAAASQKVVGQAEGILGCFCNRDFG